LIKSYSMEAIVGLSFLATGTFADVTFESSEIVMRVFL